MLAILAAVPHCGSTSPLPVSQYKIFAGKLLSPTVSGDRVDYVTFDRNLQALSSLAFLGRK